MPGRWVAAAVAARRFAPPVAGVRVFWVFVPNSCGGAQVPCNALQRAPADAESAEK